MSLTLITGASGALGSTLARSLASKGHKLALLDTMHGADRLAELAGELHGRAFAKATDVTSVSELATALHAIEHEAGETISHAALVAGGWRGGKPLHETSDEDYRAMMASNADTVFMAMRTLLPKMVEKGAGSIVVIGSRNVERPWTGANAAAYTAAKSAAVSMALASAAEVLHHGVRVNAVLISTMDTPANRKGMPHADPKKWVSLESASAVVSFLLSDESRDISGAEIPVYGRA